MPPEDVSLNSEITFERAPVKEAKTSRRDRFERLKIDSKQGRRDGGSEFNEGADSDAAFSTN